MSKIIGFLSVLLICAPLCSHANEADLVYALQRTYSACANINNQLTELKHMAGINTAITGVGTGLGIGATTVGIIKSKRDQEIDEMTAELDKMGAIEIKTTGQLYDVLANLMDETGHPKGKEMADALRQEKTRKEQQSKKLGNWRTGLLAGNTVTNVAGAIIANKNRDNAGIQEQIDSCKLALTDLKRARAQAQMNGIDVTETNAIIDACSGFETVDMSRITARAKGAMTASIVGAATGITGTITSASANSDKTRKDDTESGKQREKNLNTASNILAGTATAASATATVFNATQIKAIKDVASIAEKCTRALE